MLSDRVQEWRQQDREEGRREGQAEVILDLLEGRFGALDPATRERVRGAEVTILRAWARRLLTARRLSDVFES